jgi:hypothetical protein
MSRPPILDWDQAYNRNGDPDLPRAVVNAIRTHMNNHTLTGWVKQETLSDYTGLSVRQVRRQIDANVKAGWLEVVKLGNSSGLASSYRLAYPKADIYGTEGGHACPVKEDMDVLPTTPITTPGNYAVVTTPEKADIDVRIPPDPFGSGTRGICSSDHDRRSLDRGSTSKSKADIDVRVAKGDTGVLVCGLRDPWADVPLPEPKAEAHLGGPGFDPRQDPFA